MNVKCNPDIPLQRNLSMEGTDYESQCDVIIVNYNAGTLLADAVSSAFEAGAAKIIVVDNSSFDGSIEHLKKAVNSSQLLIVKNSKNLGFAKACNIGTNISSAQKILFLNPDCIIEKHALELMIKTLDSEIDIGMVGGFLVNPDGSEQPGGRRVFPTPKRAFMRAFGLSKFAKFFPETLSDFLLHLEPLPERPVAVEAISGACMLVKRESIDSVGLWDENYFLHCEDLDWCMRFKLSGLKVMFVPNARVVHAWGACSRSRPFFVEWHKHHGMLRFYKKFFRSKYTGLLWWSVVFGVWFRFSLMVVYYTTRIALSRSGVERG